MGAYLSEPVRDKESEDKSNDQLSYGVSSMQGWRISQEDAHNCCIDFDVDTKTTLFAVYDGHGGAEVAQYTAANFPEFLKSVPAYKENNLSKALEDAFLGFDAKLMEENVLQELKQRAGVEELDEDDEEQQNEVADLCEEAEMPIEQLLERYGAPGQGTARLRALRKEKNIHSPVIRAKATSSSSVGDESVDKDSICQDPVKTKLDAKFVNGHSENENNENLEKENRTRHAAEESDSAAEISSTVTIGKENICADKNENITEIKAETPGEVASSTDNDVSSELKCDSSEALKAEQKGDGDHSSSSRHLESSNPDNIKEKQVKEATCTSSSDQVGSSAKSEDECVPAGSSKDGSGDAGSSTPSQAGSAEGSSSGSGSGAGGSSSGSQEDAQPGSSSGRTRKPRRNVIPEEGEDESSFSESEEGDSDEDEWDSEDVCEPDSEEDEEEIEGQRDDDEDDEDEYMCGGEEPGMDSGCTAVVALLREKELYVANAGDSRCVVCRAGKAFDMSADHKPEDELEKDRIIKAGGRVTNDGRVNGGLNLSRAIGDHVYKRNEKLTPQEQMITALPDVRSISLNKEDEFMVLACDGIWNSMSSQDVVNFVKERLDAGITKLSSISEEMFEFCMSPDTTGDGTGCDNMTCIVINFKDLVDSSSSAGVKRRASNGIDSDATNDAKKPKEESD